MQLRIVVRVDHAGIQVDIAATDDNGVVLGVEFTTDLSNAGGKVTAALGRHAKQAGFGFLGI